jgi:hypothetical protein
MFFGLVVAVLMGISPFMVICPGIIIFMMVRIKTVSFRHNLVGVVQKTDYRTVVVVVWYGEMRHQHHAGEHQRHYGDFPVHDSSATKIQNIQPN